MKISVLSQRFFIFTLIVLSLFSQAAQESNSHWQVRLQAPAQKLWLGEPSDWLIISLNEPAQQNTAPATTLILPHSDGFIFESAVPNPVNENGVSGFAYPIRITPLKPGELTIPAFKLSNTTASLSSKIQTVTVNKAKQSNNMALTLTRSAKEIFVGQTLRLNLAWTINYPIEALQAVQLSLPEFHHEHINILPPWDSVDPDSKNSIGLPVSGQRIFAKWQNLADNQVKINFEVVIQPKKSGDYHFANASLLVNVDQAALNKKRRAYSGSLYPAYFDNNFFENAQEQKSYQREQVVAPAFTLKVKPLPAGAPENFTGIVGKPNISAKATPAQVKQGEPIQYSLTITHADIEAITLPNLTKLNSFIRSFDIPGEASPAIINNKVKTIHQSLFARRADIAAIPAFDISYFDTKTGLYRNFQVPPVAINVSENEQFDFSQGQSSDNLIIKNSLQKDPQGIWAHRWGESLISAAKVASNGLTKQQRQRLFISLIIIFPPLLVALLLASPLRQKRAAKRLQQPINRLEYALRKNHDPIQALSEYANQRLAISPSQFSRNQLTASILDLVETKDLVLAKQLVELLSKWIGDYQQQFSFNINTHDDAKYIKTATGKNSKASALFSTVQKLDKLLPDFQVDQQKNSQTKNLPAAPLLISTVILAVFLLPLASSPVHADDKVSIAQLQQDHQHALQLSIDNPHQANVAHAKIAAKLENFLTDDTVNQANLAYNIGSSYYHGGRYGKSILWLRRAEVLNADDSIIKHNLAQARQKRLDDLPDYFAPPWLNKINQFSHSPLWKAFCVISYLLFWLAIYLRIQRGSSAQQKLIFASLILTFTLAAKLLQWFYIPPQSNGVITSIDVVSRKGPGLIFAPAFTTPLNQGTEFILLQQQGRWSEVQLSDFSTLWLPTRALGFINEGNH